MLTNRLYSRTVSNRGGFTLVELLVVIGIIAILAGVALGPITNGLRKAKQSSAMQSAHALGLAEFSAANDLNQVYPDASGGDASSIAKTLLAGGYVTDPSIFFIAGGTAVKYTGAAASAVSGILVGNMSWDFLSDGGKGNLTTTVAPYLPLLWTTIAPAGGGTEPTTLTGSTAISGSCSGNTPGNPFGSNGMAIFYCNNSAAFVVSTSVSGGIGTVTMVSTSNNQNSAPTGLAVLVGGG